ncbi:MAG: RsmD family RNA methyltransferase [Rhodoferax sp.]|nr:RsmD family RNA methyltransferase [Rhodoferax sp.]
MIGGQWKRTRLDVVSKPGLRPTPDRVRETVFNWLGQDLTGWRCQDAFAGTGALGFEAASRGAREVRLVEQDPALVLGLKAVQARLSATTVQVVRGDGMLALKQCPRASLDVVFLTQLFDRVIVAVAAGHHKRALFSLQDRIDMAREAAKPYPQVEVESFSGLLRDLWWPAVARPWCAAFGR